MLNNVSDRVSQFIIDNFDSFYDFENDTSVEIDLVVNRDECDEDYNVGVDEGIELAEKAIRLGQKIYTVSDGDGTTFYFIAPDEDALYAKIEALIDEDD